MNQTATSDTKGDFTLEFSQDLFANVSANDVIEVGFQVTRNGQVLSSSGGIPALQPQDYQITITFQMPEEEETFQVQGTISHADGRPGTGMLMAAFDRDMRNEELLGETKIGAQGYYEITFGEIDSFLKGGNGGLARTGPFTGDARARRARSQGRAGSTWV